MEKPINTAWKRILLCPGAFLLVLSASFLACKGPHPKYTVTISGSNGSYGSSNSPAGAVTLTRGNHDMVEWRNKSDADMLVCIDQPSDPAGRAFAPTFMYVPMGGSAFSGPVRTGAKLSTEGYIHGYSFDPDPTSTPVDACPQVASGLHSAPVTIIVQ